MESFSQPTKGIRKMWSSPLINTQSANSPLPKVHQAVALTYIDANYKSKGLVVDHIDRNPLNNSLDNLRLVTKAENRINSDWFDENNKGYVKLRGKRYRAIISVNGVKYSKTFDTKTEAEDFNTNLLKLR